MRRILFLPTLFLLVLATLTFLLSARPFAGARAGGRAITVGILDDIKTLDPARMSWANDIRAAMALFEGLTMYDTRDQCQPIPAAAASWEISADGRVYTFHLRPEGRWSNGDRVTADDFIFAWKRALAPETGADYIGLLRGIEGAEEFTAALDKGQAPGALGVMKIDDLTLQVRLKAPCTYFLDLLAMPVFFPLHEASMRPFQLGKGGYDQVFTKPPHLVSNGPFHLADWKFKQHVKFTPNPYYWDRAGVQCPELIISPISNSRAALVMFERGDLDLVTNFQPPEFGDSMLRQQRSEGKWPNLHATPAFGSYYYVFNTTRKPFDDKRVRKALALAVDRRQITEILGTGERPLGLIVPPGAILGYGSPNELPYDPPQARRLLAEAGFPDGKGMAPVELLFNTEARHQKVAQAVGQMWQVNLGVNVTYRGLERGSFGTARRDHVFDIARGGWYGDYPDPTTWLDLLRTGDGNNDGRFSSAAYDALMRSSDGQADPQQRFDLLRRAEDMIVNDECPYIPLYQYTDGMLYDGGKLKGVQINSRTLIQLKWIRRE